MSIKKKQQAQKMLMNIHIQKKVKVRHKHISAHSYARIVRNDGKENQKKKTSNIRKMFML